MTESAPTYCATHPDVETNLRCGKCDKPICPRCLVQTPVGARCQDCARLYKLPTFRISGIYYLRAVGAALGTALAIGALWGVIESYAGNYGVFIGLLVFYAAGYAIAEVTGLAVNRKRGLWLGVIGGAAVVICWGTSYLVQGFYLAHVMKLGSLMYGAYHIVFVIIGIGFGVYIAVNRLR